MNSLLPTKDSRKWFGGWGLPLACGAILAAAAAVLRSQGRVWWCSCGSPWPISTDVWSLHNSQHLFDPYSLAHVLHGLVFYGALYLVRDKVSLRWRVLLIVAAETAWELFENSEFVINRYRTTTVSVDYRGDSIANSLCDIIACGVGAWLAARLGLRASVALFLAIELLLLVWIRDSLIINIIMLVHPIQAIKDWQMAIAPG